MLTITPSKPQDSELVTTQDLLTVIEQNRGRLRTLGGMIISVCGMLLSASFLVLFFLLKEGRVSVSPPVIIPLSGALASLASAIIFSVLAGFIPAPVTATTRLQLVDILATRCRREHRHAKSAIAFLLLAMLLLAGTLLTVAATTFNRPANPPLQPTGAGTRQAPAAERHGVTAGIWRWFRVRFEDGQNMPMHYDGALHRSS